MLTNMNCCDSMLKYIVFLCNFIFFLTGAAVLGIGIYVQVEFTEYYDFLSEKYLGSGIILMVVGGVILIVAFFGCCGACTGIGRHLVKISKTISEFGKADILLHKLTKLITFKFFFD